MNEILVKCRSKNHQSFLENFRRQKPDCVCVELDAKRYESLSEKKRWKTLDLKQIIRNKQLSTLMINLVLASYQKKLGDQLGVMPGSELLEAATTAQALDIPVSLCDRDVRVTMTSPRDTFCAANCSWLMVCASGVERSIS